ncbi:MAG: hypothetical protein AAF360_02265 [Pseudomonadota bacterium]
MSKFKAAALGVAPVLAACSMVESVPLGDASLPPIVANITYSLPRLIVDAEVVIDGGTARFENVEGVLTRDPDHTYALAYTPSPLSSDELTIQVDAATGFVTMLDAKATDATAEFLKVALETAITAGLLSDGDIKAEGAATRLRFSFDPHSELPSINAALASFGYEIRCEGCAAPAPTGPQIDGVYTRPLTTIRLLLVDVATGRLEDSEAFASPNGSRLVALPVNRSAGVERLTKYETFAPGGPTKVVQTKPSEALGVVTGIGAAVGAVVASPIQGAANIVAQTEAQTSVEQAQADLAEAQAARTEAEQKAREAEAAFANAQLELSELRRSGEGEEEEGN